MPTARDKANRTANAEAHPVAGPGRGASGDELTALLSAISEVLGEMADAEADAAYHIPCAPLEEGLAGMLYRLRQRLLVDVGYCLPEAALIAGSSFDAKARDSHSGCDSLHIALDDILELALASGYPSITWAEIESRFRCFARRLTEDVSVRACTVRESSRIRSAAPK